MVTAKKTDLLRDTFGIPKDDLIYIYQGVINTGRGIEIMIEAFSKVDKNNHLVVMGFGGLEHKIIEAAKNHQNIHFMPAVKPQQIPLYTSGADVGLIIAENLGLSYYYGLPNKLFEYLYCGLPVITSDFPEMGKIVHDYQCGWTIMPQTEELIAIISQMSIESIDSKKTELKYLYDEVNWEKDITQLKNVFNG